MRYIPKEIEGNVNVSHVSPIRELFLLLGGLMGIALAVYVMLGFAVNKAVDWMPGEAETGLARVFTERFTDGERTEEEEKLQQLLQELLKKAALPIGTYTVHIYDSDRVNAAAMPGRNIVVFKGLMEAVQSDRELAFVLAHELGHFANRDHLRGLGRGLVMVAISAALLGGNNAATDFTMNSVVKAEMKFSQRQELAADHYAARLMKSTYGDINGAEEFLDRIRQKEKMGKLQYYFASHPHPEIRIDALRSFAAATGKGNMN